ncbi:hypothetical protein SRIMM317S_05811 [Streptomyces rimosus subsp. rimosus]
MPASAAMAFIEASGPSRSTTRSAASSSSRRRRSVAVCCRRAGSGGAAAASCPAAGCSTAVARCRPLYCVFSMSHSPPCESVTLAQRNTLTAG